MDLCMWLLNTTQGWGMLESRGKRDGYIGINIRLPFYSQNASSNIGNHPDANRGSVFCGSYMQSANEGTRLYDIMATKELNKLAPRKLKKVAKFMYKSYDKKELINMCLALLATEMGKRIDRTTLHSLLIAYVL